MKGLLGLGAPAWVERILSSEWNDLERTAGSDRLPIRRTVGDELELGDELGCGHYGCVFPTPEAGIVLKITTDPSEAWFAANAIAIGDWPRGITPYTHVVKLGKHSYRNRPVYALWRAEAFEIGYLKDGNGYGFAEPRRMLGHFRDAAQVIYAHYRDAPNEERWLLDLDGMAKWDEWAFHSATYDNESPLGDIKRWRGPQRYAAAFHICQNIAELMQHTYGADALGEALSFYLERGLLMSDVHLNNVGKMMMDDGAYEDAVITDPGQCVPLSQVRLHVEIEEI